MVYLNPKSNLKKKKRKGMMISRKFRQARGIFSPGKEARAKALVKYPYFQGKVPGGGDHGGPSRFKNQDPKHSRKNKSGTNFSDGGRKKGPFPLAPPRYPKGIGSNLH